MYFAERRTHIHVRPAGCVVESRDPRKDALVLDVVIAEIGVYFADADRRGEVSDVRGGRADVDLAGAKISIDAAERAVNIDRAVARVHFGVGAGWQFGRQI